jgi:hypothetical protein
MLWRSSHTWKRSKYLHTRRHYKDVRFEGFWPSRSYLVLSMSLVGQCESQGAAVVKAAIVQGVGQTPIYADFAEPLPSANENRIAVTASAMSQVVKSRASSVHYSSTSQFPFVVGIDGVGRLNDGAWVYFAMPREPYGSMAELSIAPAAQCLPVPEELDDVTAAAIAIPGTSSWAAY